MSYPQVIAGAPGGTCCWSLAPIRGGIGWIEYHPVSNVYADACDQESLLDPPVGPTVVDLVTALDQQANSEVSGVKDVTLGGYPGRRFDFAPGGGLESCPREGAWQSHRTLAGLHW